MDGVPFVWSATEIASAAQKATDWIINSKGEYNHRKILLAPVLDGGLMYWSYITRYLRQRAKPFDYQSVWVSGYSGDGQKRDAPLFMKTLTGNWDGHFIVVVDDIYDTGATAKLILTDLINKYSTQDLVYTALVNANPGLGSKYQVGSTKCFSPLVATKKQWFVGFGLDSEQQYRGDHEIWAKAVKAKK